MSYTYTTYVAALVDFMATSATNPNFVTILPTIIDQAEQRIYRELDLLSTVVRDSSANLTANSRSFTLPQHFVVTNGFNVYTLVSSTTTRNQLWPTSRDFLDQVWPTESAPFTPSVPVCWAMITDQQIIVGPAPDAAYTMEVIGTIRPVPLSASNPTTYLTTYLSDLFMDASMITASGYQQNFGQASDNPAMAISWSEQYDKHLASANIEELRKKWMAFSWSSQSPAPTATPVRS